MSDVIDVVVVGYGPVGQALTIALAQFGYRVVVVEQWPSLYSLPRAVVYDHEVARILQSLGVADAMMPHTATSKTYEWRNGQGQALKVFRGMDEMAISGWPDKLGFCQPELEAILDSRVRSFGNQVEVLQGWKVVSATDEGDAVCLTASAVTENGAPLKTIRARYVVGCDGAGSLIRQAMGSSYEDLGFSADWLVVDVKPSDPQAWNNEQIQLCDPARPTTLVAGGPGRRRAEFMLLPGESREAMNNAETAWRLLAAHGWRPDNAMLERHAVYNFRGCIARKWRVGRMILAGDAAHLTPPFAGQGLCAGLRDVAALSWRLDHILRGSASPSLLESYGLERAEHARRFIQFAIELGGVICVLDPDAAAARDAYLLGPGASEEARYPESRLSASDMVRVGDPHAGDLSLQGMICVGQQKGRFDDLVGNGFVLLSLDEDVTAHLDEAQQRFMAQVGIRSLALGVDGDVIDVDGQYSKWFRSMGCRTVLIRPDFYMYGSGDAVTLIRCLKNSGLWLQNEPADLAQTQAQALATTALVTDYFRARQLAQASPTALKNWIEESREDILVLDVRNPNPALTNRILGALSIPESDLAARCGELPRNKLLVLYCWDTWCSLATSAALTLLEQGFRVKELSGGIRAWQMLGFPMVEAQACGSQPCVNDRVASASEALEP